jgi:hypothetical protein
MKIPIITTTILDHQLGDSLTIIIVPDPILPMIIISDQILDSVIIAIIMVVTLEAVIIMAVTLEAVIIIIDDEHELDFNTFTRHFFIKCVIIIKSVHEKEMLF